VIDLESVLKVAVQGKASDVHLKVGLPPLFRLKGGLVPLRNASRIHAEEMELLLTEIASEEQLRHLHRERELDFSYSLRNLGRFRANAFFQKGVLGLVLRIITNEVLSVSELGLPPVLEKIALENRGLVLVTGATGSGKSTTLAALIQHINLQRSKHILTVEDPIEYIFRDKRSIINQREVGDDTLSFSKALRAALRQDPDVILVGEMRDKETIETALVAAETGHLVLSTLHTLDAPDSVNRIVGVYPPYQHAQIRIALATVLKAVISQRLIKRADNRGRVPAMEIMINTGRVRELLQEEAGMLQLRETIAAGFHSYGMQTFDQSLMQHLKRGLITQEEALKQSSNPDDFLLRLQGIEGAGSNWEAFE